VIRHDQQRAVERPDVPAGPHRSDPIRILTMLEASSVTGVVKPVLEFAREARRSTGPPVELTVLTFLRGDRDNAFIEAVRAEGLPLEIVREARPFDPRVILRLRAAVRRWRPHIVWTHSVKSHLLVRMAGLCGRAKWVAFHHGYTTTARRTRVYNELDRWSLRGADRLLTACSAFADELRRRGQHPARIRIQHMPIRPAPAVPAPLAAALRRELDVEPPTRVVLSVGRLSREKGHADLLRATAAIRQVRPSFPLRVLLVGDGPERDRLQALADELALGDVVMFLGHRDEVALYYAVADLFVLPSHSEGSPNVLLEAIDAGVPIVATGVGGVPEMVTGGREALLVPRHDVAAMTCSIVTVLDDPGLQARLVAAARHRLSRHSPGEFFLDVTSIFQELVGTRR
jgi:glycosyltransferase involved in cell wall biosynthesis